MSVMELSIDVPVLDWGLIMACIQGRTPLVLRNRVDRPVDASVGHGPGRGRSTIGLVWI